MRRSSLVYPPSASLGDSHVEEAVRKINILCQRTMTTMTEYSHPRDETVTMLFSPDVRARASAAKGLIDPTTNVIGYNVANSVNLFLNYGFDTSIYPPIERSAWIPQPNITPLLDFIETVRGIHEQFEEMKAVLRWLNREATAGAARYYFPVVLALCPQSPALRDLQHVPSRYTQPNDIGNWTQSIKDASACYAGTQMLPSSAAYRPRGAQWLTFDSYVVQRGSATFRTDSMTYNL